MKEDRNRDDIVKGYSLFKSQVEVPTPPPPGFTSPFRTVQEWLIYVCDNNQPDKSISEYRFDLYESPGNNLLCLVGYNHTVEQGVPTSRVDFKPSQHMFFALPNDEYENSLHQRVQQRVFKDLKQFLNTDIFKRSFLSKGYTITTNFAGDIWSK